jgi:zinc protease
MIRRVRAVVIGTTRSLRSLCSLCSLCPLWFPVWFLFLCSSWFLLFGTSVAVQVRNWPAENPPRPLPAHDVKFPPYQLQTLPNGLQVVAVLHHAQPLVSMRLLVRAGTSADSKGRLGLAHIVAALLDQGTAGAKPKSAQEIADEIDFIGGEMGAGAGPDLTHANMVVMKDSFEVGMRMLSETARNPMFAPKEIDRQRQQMLSGLQVSAQDPEYIANSVFDRLVYGFHPYGLPESGTPETLTAIARDDLVAFHTRYFTPNNAILAIVGDVTAEEAFDMARKVFGDWPRGEIVADKYLDPPDPTRRVVVVDKPDAVQTEVRVGHLGVPRSHPDYMAINLAIRILGGEGSNRLHQVLRTERGLTYGAQANMDALKVTGDFEAQTNTRSEATGEVLRLIVDEFWRLQRDRVGERELADAKAYLTGSFPLTIETPNAIAMQVVNNLFYGLPLDHLQNFRERVNAVTVDDIQRVAQKYLKPDRLSVVLVGNARAFASQLRGVGFPNYETVELADLDLMAANFKRPATRAGAAAAPAPPRDARAHGVAYRQSPAGSRPQAAASSEGTNAAALLDRAIRAKGGLDKLQAVRTIVVKQTLTSRASERPMAIETTNYIQYPDRFRTETQTGNGVNVQVFDGTRGWARDPQGVHDMPEAMARDARTTLRRDPIALLVGARTGALTPRLLPDVKDAGGRLHHALEISAPDLNPVVLFIDPENALIDKQTFVADAPGRPLIEEEFSDYRPVDGVQIAFQAMRRNGAQSLERRITDIKINTPLDATLFKRPS